jgi:hypothetical protein
LEHIGIVGAKINPRAARSSPDWMAAMLGILLKNSALQNGTKLPSNLDFPHEISIRF